MLCCAPAATAGPEVDFTDEVGDQPGSGGGELYATRRSYRRR